MKGYWVLSSKWHMHTLIHLSMCVCAYMYLYQLRPPPHPPTPLRRSMPTRKLYCQPWQAGLFDMWTYSGCDDRHKRKPANLPQWMERGNILDIQVYITHKDISYFKYQCFPVFCWLHEKFERTMVTWALAMPFCTAVCNWYFLESRWFLN